MKKPRMFATLAGIAVIVAFVLYVPLPHSVLCILEIQARDAASVFVTAPGTLEEISVRPGQRVEEGDPLARLKSIELELQVLQLESEWKQQEIHLENVQRLSISSRAGGMRIGQLEKSLDKIEKQLAEKKRDFARLQLRAPIAGTVLPPPWTPRKEAADGQLAGWHGTPLSPRNLGAYLEAKPPVLFCLIGNPEEMEANLVIDQSKIDFIRPGQDVEIKLEELPHDTFEGSIREIAKIDLKVSPRNLSAKMGGDLATETDAGGVERPLSTSYQVRVIMDDPEAAGLLRLGLRGRAKVHTAPQTLGHRAWRLIAETFNFVL